MFNAGKYIIGDLCYLFNDKTWQKLCEKELDNNGAFKVNNFICWQHSTAYGDGFYPFGYSKKVSFEGFPVDAGLIGIVPIEILEDKSLVDRTEASILSRNDMLIIEIKHSFEPYYENGTFHFSDLEIWTEDEEFDDNEEDDYNDDDEENFL